MRNQQHFNNKDKSILQLLIQEKTGYCIKSSDILSQAFRRRSYAAENCGKSNEIFEFIGDQVLSYYVVKILAERCGGLNLESDYSCRIRENHFTSLKQQLTSNEKFAEIIDEWGVAEYLIVGRADEKNRVDEQTKVKADLFEAIIGAIAIDAEWDAEVLETAVKLALRLDETIDAMMQDEYASRSVTIDNAVTTLKELAEAEKCSMPQYEFSNRGNLVSSLPQWYCQCTIINDVTTITKDVYASSKKDAKKAAAYLVLCEHLQIQNQYDANEPSRGRSCLWIYKDGKLMPADEEHN